MRSDVRIPAILVTSVTLSALCAVVRTARDYMKGDVVVSGRGEGKGAR
ncbi:MAG TPA: hypothetical protein VE129_10055 [Thermoanaerobaculia bacterium]|nr:hypothetical protein [Thermoanaerobaculia bacterium]